MVPLFLRHHRLCRHCRCRQHRRHYPSKNKTGSKQATVSLHIICEIQDLSCHACTIVNVTLFAVID